ncbi:hypothetical protein DIURU_004114 [Diutina rugosa]|uniref:FK506-binding protein n=1 Tax=Diutina rugosa TaxID=5481 RepID=A0A642UN02_DIURU|nr:uncharacterized protein DIURU_004114 [Diutina rugosa]KAA8899857.1 hypothetical protein DIURU_004114 [Diutina rugosa]
MAELIPISTYNLALKPFDPTPAIDADFPVTIQITGAAIDPEAVDDKNQPSTLRILKKSDADDIDSDEGDSDEEDEEDEEEEEEKPQKKSKGKKAAKDEEEEDEDEEDEEDDEDEDDEDDEAITEHVLCTLSPNTQYQFPLTLTISPDEEVYFVATGSYPIHLHGNYIQHPADLDEDDYSDDSEDELDGLYDDEDDDEYDSEEMEANRIEELVDDEAEEEQKPASKKRSADGDAKDSKKAKKAVQFTKELEQGPTGSTYTEGKDAKKDTKKETKKDKKEAKKESKKDEAKKEETESNGKKFPTKTLLGGVITEDRKVGTGKAAKSGQKVSIRYIGKLKNGKVFDKNTSGKPFSFTLGKGECIKGFDLGVAGMAIGGERRVIIPAKMGYGSQALPGIPANSELTFDIKLVSLK